MGHPELDPDQTLYAVHRADGARLAAAVRLPIKKAEPLAKRFKSTIGHNQNVNRHVDITHRIP